MRVKYQAQHYCWNKYWMDIYENQYYQTIEEAKRVIDDYNKERKGSNILTKYPTRILKSKYEEQVINYE